MKRTYFDSKQVRFDAAKQLMMDKAAKLSREGWSIVSLTYDGHEWALVYGKPYEPGLRGIVLKAPR